MINGQCKQKSGEFRMKTMFMKFVVLFLATSVSPTEQPTCLDWQNKTVANGEEFYPKAHDPCHICTCSDGQKTMCKDVSCQPPSCPNWRQVPGKCCKFECMDGNSTGIADGM